MCPTSLWVKDTESRFLVANKALTIDNGKKDTNEVIGQSDFDFHAPEIASGFRADELEILRSGKPMIDKEEYVIEAQGITSGCSSTKVPLRDENNETSVSFGIARNITDRKRADSLARRTGANPRNDCAQRQPWEMCSTASCISLNPS